MAQASDIILGGTHYAVVPGSYRKRNKRTGTIGARFERVTVEDFKGQRQAFAADTGEEQRYSWDGLGVGPAFDGQGVEPFPNLSSHADAALLDIPSTTVRAHGAVAGTNAFIGIGQRIYKSVALTNGTWANFTAAADLGAGFTVSGLAFYQDDLLVMLATGQDIRKFNTSSNALSVWRTGEKAQLGVGYAGQLIYAPRAANNQEELRLSGTKWNGNAVTHLRYLDSPIVNMALFNGFVAIATKTSLYLMGGQPYPGEADDATVTSDTSKAPEWRGDPEPLMTHGQFAAGDDFTFLCSYRGRLYTWLQGRVAEYDGDRTWLRGGPEGVRCFGGCVAGDWLTVAISSRYGGFELWGFNGEGWWKFAERSSPAYVWPNPLAGAGDRELIVFQAAGTTYDRGRLNWRSNSVNTYAATAEWVSPLLDGGEPGSSKAWSAIGAGFAMPENRGNVASVDSVTVALGYSIDGGETWTTAASLTSTDPTDRTRTLAASFVELVDARYFQLRVTWSSVSDWAPVLASVWAEYEVPEVLPAKRHVWQLEVDASDRTVRRDGSRDGQSGAQKSAALWAGWRSAGVGFTDIDGSLWDPSLLDGVGLWLAPDRLSGFADGDLIAEWASAADAGIVATATPGEEPTYQAGELNGLPVARFAGNAWLTVASTLGITSQPYSIFGVWKAGAAGQALTHWANNTGLIVTDFDDDIGIFSGSALFNFNQHAFNAWHVIAATYDAAGSLGVDGNTPVVGGTGAGVPSGNLTIGAGAGGADRWLNGDLGELIITRSAPSLALRQRIEGYLAHKWGLTANLPGGHPYKVAAPSAAYVVRVREIEARVDKPADRGRWGESVVALTLEEL
jgi:hypothetical protein